ncbi:MTAP family purine nucleoside phosphorylase [Candidatus Gottesmanbacteria bacterium]|nr:MTAP family purine nucleoside phosphorylase [Candidatus Gottesmanbacteria bacterium]
MLKYNAPNCLSLLHMPLKPEVPRAVIGGTGFSEKATDYITISTDYGDVQVGHIELGGKEIHFLARHQALEVPHLVNYRANIQALKKLDVNVVYAVSACGRLAEDVWPGHLVAVDDVDWDDLEGRVRTYAEKGVLIHAAMHDPFSDGLREYLQQAWIQSESQVRELYKDAPTLKVGYHDGGTYFNINGPSFSPPKRETRLRRDVVNAKVIGQTLVPEVHLAREMGIAYAALGMCVDHSNFPGAPPVTHKDVMQAVEKTSIAAVYVLDNTVRFTPDNFFDEVAHNAMKYSIIPSQVDLDMLRVNGRTNLALILDQELQTRT